MFLVNARLDKWLWFLFIVILSGYILYEHATSCLAIDLATQIDRHHRILAGESEFYNPWQYRIFAPFLLQGIISIAHTLLPGKPEILSYLLLSFIQNVLILYISVYYYKALSIRNPFLVLIGIIVLAFCISNSVFQSDLSFNTYFDIIFYLLAGLFILNGKYYLIIPLTILAALNRETSGFIPFMLIATVLGIEKINLSNKKVIITGLSFLLFIVVFGLIRFYYGYRAPVGIHGMVSPKDYFMFNIKFFRMYPQWIGTMSIIPLVVCVCVRRLPLILKRWFWLIVPFWFLIHLISSTAMESRLFLVPQALIFMPALLWLVEDFYTKKYTLQPVRNRGDET